MPSAYTTTVTRNGTLWGAVQFTTIHGDPLHGQALAEGDAEFMAAWARATTDPDLMRWDPVDHHIDIDDLDLTDWLHVRACVASLRRIAADSSVPGDTVVLSFSTDAPDDTAFGFEDVPEDADA